jgi:hypothetical protein
MRGRRFRSGALIAVAGVLFVASSRPAAPVGAAELRGLAKVGYDTFIDRFTILEVDTIRSIQEYYAGIGGSLDIGSAARMSIANLFKIGTQTMDDNLDLDATTGAGRRVATFRGSLRWKHFQPGTDYELGNDFLQSNAVVRLRNRLSPALRLAVGGRFESIDFDKRTAFDYDYRYVDGGVELEAGSTVDRMLLLEGYFGFRDTPDTAALDYRRGFAELDARYSTGRIAFHIESVGDRRDYRGVVRSSYWSLTSLLDVSIDIPHRLAFSARGQSDLFLFDRPDDIFFDTQFLRGGLRVRRSFGAMSNAYVEPRYAILRCPDVPEERYSEATAVIGIEYLRSGDFWLSASYEPGCRRYAADPNDLYSNYTINRISLMANVPLPFSSALSIFVAHDPERHSRGQDDFSVTLFSVDVTTRF